MSTFNPYDFLYSVRFFPREIEGKKLFLNSDQLINLNLKIGQDITFVIGFTKLLMEVAEQDFDNSPTTIYLSRNCYFELNYFQGEPLCLTFFSSETIVLGLTLAMTLPSKTFGKIKRYPAIKERALLASEKGIFFYCISPTSFDLEKELVEGYILDSRSSRWLKRQLPLPQVFYTRSFFPRSYFPNKLWINDVPHFDKWSNYQALISSPETASFQPETSLLTLNTLSKFLLGYNFSYIKNIYGRCGRQVVRVEKRNQHFTCKAGGKKIKREHFQNLSELYTYLQNTLGKELIIQQGILLKRLNNRPFDMRILVQKNIVGHWNITAVSLRIAQPHSIVTNVALGAKEVVLTPKDKLPFSELSWEKLKEFSLKSLNVLEENLGSLGEVGLDVALDINGRLWLLEANSQPSSRGYLEATNSEVCKQIFGLPLDYAKYLAYKKYKSQSF